jgi:DNA replication protein DnaC
MNNLLQEIEQMLDFLKLHTMGKSLKTIMKSNDYSSYDPIQLFRDILSDEYIVQLNTSIDRNLKLAKLTGSDAQIENLKTGNGRMYQDSTIKQLASLEFISDRKNIAIFGESDAGKTYASKAFGIQACKNGYRTLFTDFTNLIDYLFMLKDADMNKYKKKLNYYSRIQVLILDDFLITHLGNDRSLILFSLIKNRDELGTSTIITSQYDPRTWISFLESDGNFAMGDSIRRRLLNNGYSLLIEKAV